MKISSAKCPSCGGNLEIPDNKDYVTCHFCENTVRVRDAVPLSEINKIGNYLEIAYNAIKVRNFEEGLNFVYFISAFKNCAGFNIGITAF